MLGDPQHAPNLIEKEESVGQRVRPSRALFSSRRVPPRFQQDSDVLSSPLKFAFGQPVMFF